MLISSHQYRVPPYKMKGYQMKQMRNIKKKFLSLLLAGCLIITGTGCNGGGEHPEEYTGPR